ncbi:MULTISPECIES: SAM-dependent methyltransferase [unclassified Halorhodospira]|uniref:SAM-dependent methyltransferase n=1 Tax=unclassified Halorhodospira TaxID=2626748 RepID=UPI001EE7A221|nr:MULTISPECIES: cyclopropane-fatty-acyl-phospholipid synthase family protein [unclassified Halorhodospira]MCG5541886.1 cyclopropane-fatty-acyl-phospholipid synthase family protein [Halorhodospira sp. M39old]MCG5546957.1 cyclopropane-fatty-acyl-phospholipid synthase family protein [Halorhodospira sp. M38]
MPHDAEHTYVNERNPLAVPQGERVSSGPSAAPERWLTRRLYELVGSPALEVRLWDGSSVGSGDSTLAVEIMDRGALYELLRNPNLAYGDLYSTGRIEVHGELKEVMNILVRAANEHEGRKPAWLEWLWRDKPSSGADVSGARGNIHHHYDLGNEFYSLWLDHAAMQYTCAYFESPDNTLEQAQLAKLEHVCRKVRLQPGETVIEAGCGWGGLARYMAKQYGAKVRAFNISREQIEYAREQARREGLDHLVEYVEDDYRNISGSCDHFVSVGMLEHVGPANYEALAKVARRCLHPEGLGLIHTIGRNRPRPVNKWIEQRIFPGAYVPSAAELMTLFEYDDLSVLDVENLRLHYAQTLDNWLERFRVHRDWVAQQYDERFARAWELYLATSSATFTQGGMQLFQVVFAPARSNNVPRNRAHLYETTAAPREWADG